MAKQSLVTRILITLFRAASRGRLLTSASLAEQIGIEAALLEGLMLELDRAGYVDSERLRLTLPGLALAVAASKKTQSRSFSRAA